MDKDKITNIQFGGIDHSDYPDFVDAYIENAELDGKPMSEEDIEKLNEDRDFVYESLINHLF